MQKVFLNGKFVPLKNAKVSIFDRGFLYGDGVFETMRSYNGRVFMLKEHIDRLTIALKILKIKIPYNKITLSKLVQKSVQINKAHNAYVKLLVARGVGSTGIDLAPNQKPTITIYTKRLNEVVYDKIRKKGLQVKFACISRNENSFTSRIKNLNYLNNILARQEAREAGFDEAIFLNTKGFVAEAATSNIFMIKNGKVFTPPPTSGLLPGITRQAVIGIIKKYTKNKLYEKNVTPTILLNADELFLTNSGFEIIPVVKVGNTKIGKGKPGPFTRFIHALYKTEVENV